MLRFLLSICFATFAVFAIAQNSEFTAEEQAELDELEAFLNDTDSASIISLLDSLIALEESLNRSQIALRVGYNSEEIIAERESLGTENGTFAGASYYHKSGAFVDLISFWNSQFEPKRYLTSLSIGYLGLLGKKLTFLGSYEHYFFNDAAETQTTFFPYSDGFNASMYFVTKHLETGSDYSITLGNDIAAAHRLNYSLIGNIGFKNVWFLKEISFRPTFSLLWGNQLITSLEVDRRFLDPRRRFYVAENNTFGLMNIGFLLPVYLKYKSFNLSLSYQINLPQELEGENLSYSESNVFNASLTYFIKL